MEKSSQHILVHFVSIVGLGVLLYAYPLAFALLLFNDYQIIDLFSALGIPVEIRAFLILPLSVLLVLAGFLFWLPQRKSQLAQLTRLSAPILESSSWMQRAYCSLALLLAGLVPLAILACLAFVLFMYVFVAAFSTTPPSATQEIYDIVYVLIHLGFAFAQFAMAFLVARFYWRLLQSTRADRAAAPQHTA